MENSKIRLIVREILSEFITRRELGDIENYADSLFNDVNVDVEFSSHFIDRVNDPRNESEIMTDELIDLFTKTYNKYGQKIPSFRSGTEAVINDINSNIHIPFILIWDKNKKQFELVGKTIMKKKNFNTPNFKLKV